MGLWVISRFVKKRSFMLNICQTRVMSESCIWKLQDKFASSRTATHPRWCQCSELQVAEVWLTVGCRWGAASAALGRGRQSSRAEAESTSHACSGVTQEDTTQALNHSPANVWQPQPGASQITRWRIFLYRWQIGLPSSRFNAIP